VTEECCPGAVFHFLKRFNARLVATLFDEASKEPLSPTE
jgi:hypothetical protein